MRLSWLLRGSRWRTFHLHRCRECGRRFTDDEPGAVVGVDGVDVFPEWCSCPDRRSHVNCRACAGYCPGCAVRLRAELDEIARLYRD
jgi:hypothetical protein